MIIVNNERVKRSNKKKISFVRTKIEQLEWGGGEKGKGAGRGEKKKNALKYFFFTCEKIRRIVMFKLGEMNDKWDSEKKAFRFLRERGEGKKKENLFKKFKRHL